MEAYFTQLGATVIRPLPEHLQFSWGAVGHTFCKFKTPSFLEENWGDVDPPPQEFRTSLLVIFRLPKCPGPVWDKRLPPIDCTHKPIEQIANHILKRLDAAFTEKEEKEEGGETRMPVWAWCPGPPVLWGLALEEGAGQGLPAWHTKTLSKCTGRPGGGSSTHRGGVQFSVGGQMPGFNPPHLLCASSGCTGGSCRGLEEDECR